MKFQCPLCGAKIRIRSTSDGQATISCPGCQINEVLEFNPNPDEIFLEFLVRFDKKQEARCLPDAPGGMTTTTQSTNSQTGEVSRTPEAEKVPEISTTERKIGEAEIRTEGEIRKIIGGEKPDAITQEVLFSKECYLADYRVLRETGAEIGSSVRRIGLDARIVSELGKDGITNVYRFQHDAIKSILAGDDTVIEAPTASGKTEAFLIPIIQKIISDGCPSGIYAVLVYPTKALSRDQFPKIQKIARATGITAAVFDGDVEATERRNITDKPPQILVTNFDLLHYHMRYNTRLSWIFNTIKILVVDEAHTYSGIFGSNVHYIIKRLKRLVDASRMQIVAASATLDDPREFCTRLFDTDRIKTVRGTGREKQIEFGMLFPSKRRSRTIMVDLVDKFAGAGHQTLVFSNSHRNA